MKKYIVGLLVGLLIAFAIMMMVVQAGLWREFTLSQENKSLREQKIKIQYKLDKANKYISTLTYNFNYNMTLADEKAEEFREKIKKLKEIE